MPAVASVVRRPMFAGVCLMVAELVSNWISPSTSICDPVRGRPTSWGGGAYGFLRSLAIHGPLTVPRIAAMRPTSRQRMQRLADELAGEGLVEFVDNPKHRRSKLVRLTAEGSARYRELTARLLAIASTADPGLGEAAVRKASDTLRELSDDLGRGVKEL